MTEAPHRSASAVGSLFRGGGEVGALMRDHDWSTSPLGSPATWPQSLQSVVDLLLSSKFPMFLAWGPELGFLYNDPYAEILGAKHPSALGRRFHDVWSEVWSDISPLIDAALAGEATWFEDLPLVINRQGSDEQAWFTFSYSPARDEAGDVVGMFCAVTETTGKVLAAKRQAFQALLDTRLRDLDDLEEVVVAGSELLAREVGASHAAYARVEPDQRHVLVKGEWGQGALKGRHDLSDYGPAFLRALQQGVPVVVGDVRADSRTNSAEALPAFERIGVAALLNVPLLKDGKLVANALAHSAEPRAWSKSDIQLACDMAERVWSALERVRAQSAARDTDKRYRTAALATNDAIWDWELRANRVLWNEALLTAHGYTADQVEPTGDWWISRIHPEDRDRIDRSIHAVIDGDGENWSDEYRFLRGDGGFAEVLDRGYVVRDASGAPLRMIGAMLDLTERKRAEEAVRLGEERLRFALEAGGLGAWELDLQTRALTTSASCREIFGRPAHESFTYEDLGDVIHPDDRARQAAAVQAAVEGRQDYNIEYRVVWPSGQVRWVNVRGRPVYDEHGTPLRMAGVSVDINHRMLADLHQRLLIDELNHRVKNTLATIQSIAVQTFRVENGVGAPPEQRELFESRLIALSKVHDVLTRENWEGARLRDVVLEAVAAHCGGDQNAFTVQGPDPRLAPKMALSLSMALHELCTNAAKYGSLSVPNGRVSIRWTVEEIEGDNPRLKLRWEEEGGPPVSAPTRKGFGSRLIERQLARELRGSVTLDYAPAGVVCTLEVPLVQTSPGAAQLLASATAQ